MKKNKQEIFIFTPAANNNLIIWILSKLALPISKIFIKFKFSPNFISVLSFILMIISCFFIIEENFMMFLLTFISSIILDFCDGQVARISNKINQSKFNLDHFFDIIKISFIYLSFGILLNQFYSWLFIFLSYFLFSFNIYLHGIVGNLKEISKKKLKKNSKKFMFFRYFHMNFFLMVLKFIIPILFTFNAHSLLLILLILIDIEMIYFIFTYFNLVFIYRIIKNSNMLLKIRK